MTKTISLTYRSSRDRDRNTPTGESTRGSRRKRLASSKSDTAATQRSNPWSHGTLQGGERTRALRRGSSCAATLTKLRRTQSAPKRKRGALELSRSPRNTPDRPSPMSLMRRTPSTPRRPHKLQHCRPPNERRRLISSGVLMMPRICATFVSRPHACRSRVASIRVAHRGRRTLRPCGNRPDPTRAGKEHCESLTCRAGWRW